MKKLVAYTFIIFGVVILIGSFSEFLRDKDTYRIVHSWKTSK